MRDGLEGGERGERKRVWKTQRDRARTRERSERHVQRERDIGQRYENKNRYRQSG